MTDKHFTRLRPAAKKAARIASDNRGVVAIIFGIAFVPIIMMMGVAVDYSSILVKQSRLNRLADAAALAAARAAAQAEADCAAETGHDGAPPDNCHTNKFVERGVAAGLRAFGSEADTRTTPDVSVEKSNGAWAATARYTSDIPTTILKVFGRKSTTIAGVAKSQISLGVSAYLNFHLLLDRSMSMGIGATSMDIARLQNLTSCAFGCHTAGYEKKYYYEPKAQGIRFRIDDLRDAASALVSQAKSVAAGSNLDHIMMGVYAFNHQVTPLVAMTSDLNAVSDAVRGLDLATRDDGTQLADALKWVNNKVSRGGNGLSKSSPLEIVFLVTDGVDDGIYTGWSGMVGPTGKPLSWWPKSMTKANTGAFPVGSCDALKEKGAIIAVVYTTYVPFVGTEQYDKLIGPFAANISPNLESCATPGYYFVASEPGDINRGMKSLFEKAVAASKLRLTH